MLECPCCLHITDSFSSYGTPSRTNARCPNCGAMERDRLNYLFIKDLFYVKYIDNLKGKFKILHFTPEKVISDLFKSYNNVEYISVDITPGRAMRVEDITKLSFEDDSFDFIYCSHVLEHISDDIKAMGELYRVLKPYGSAITQVPFCNNLTKTLEDKNVVTDADRLRLYGQKDHVRMYAPDDFIERLRSVGFDVSIDKFYNSIPNDDKIKHALVDYDIYLSTKII